MRDRWDRFFLSTAIWREMYKIRIYVFHKFLMLGEKLSHLSLKHKISKRLPENIGEYRWADTDQGGAVTS